MLKININKKCIYSYQRKRLEFNMWGKKRIGEEKDCPVLVVLGWQLRRRGEV